MLRRVIMLKLGVDVGGTFTDFAIYDEETGKVSIHKILTTPENPSRGVMEGLEGLLKREGNSLAQVQHAIHGTTLATNIIIERKGDAALITTKGFRDVLEIQRQKRYDMYDVSIDKPKPLASRQRILEVDERVMYDGTILKPLEEEDVLRAISRIMEWGGSSIAVSLIHSYANPVHERKIKEIIERCYPAEAGLMVSLSSEVSPHFREYERTNTTVVNAYVMRSTREYLRAMLSGLKEGGLSGNLYILQSSGGIALVEAMEKYPVRMVESGPAAGAIMASFYGRVLGEPNLISFDMGGTTAKVCMVQGGEVSLVQEFEADMIKMKPGSGLPISIPSVDIVEIGAGGGSIARVKMGIITVGPDSAGVNPGPICYGRGGAEPTVTDADLLLGYLDPDYFLGGKMKLYPEAAEEGIRTRMALPLGLDVVTAAWGIHEMVNSNMTSAIRMVSVERGKDPRDFAFIAFGGAGPVHGSRLARGLGIPKVIIPASAGVTSAIGMLVADIRFDFSRTRVGILNENIIGMANAIFQEMEEQGYDMLRQSGAADQYRFMRSADMRYQGQGHEVQVVAPNGELGTSSLEILKNSFFEAYARSYGYSDEHDAVEVVNWRLSAVSPGPRINLSSPLVESPGHDALKGERRAYFKEAGGFVECPVYDRYRLSPGAILMGPAILEEAEATAVILPGDRCTADQYGNLIIECTC